MTHDITRELLVTTHQRTEVGPTPDTAADLKALRDRMTALAGRVCINPGTDDDLPNGRTMGSGEHFVSLWTAVSEDHLSDNTVQGRLHIQRTSIGGDPFSWVLAESRLVSPTASVQSSASEIASFSGLDNPDEIPTVTLGPRDQLQVQRAALLTRSAALLVARLEESF